MTSTPVVLFTVYTAVMVLLAAVLSYDDWRGAVAAMSFYFLGAIAFHVSKGAR